MGRNRTASSTGSVVDGGNSGSSGNSEVPFIIEAGASTGEHLSNSLYFEKSRKWDCLLVEPTKNFVFDGILPKKRNCHVIFGAIALENLDITSFRSENTDTDKQGFENTTAFENTAAADLLKFANSNFSTTSLEDFFIDSTTSLEDFFTELQISTVGTTSTVAFGNDEVTRMNDRIWGKSKPANDTKSKTKLGDSDSNTNDKRRINVNGNRSSEKTTSPNVTLDVVSKEVNGNEKVRAYPFNLIMAALNRTTVDILSLDTEMTELSILKTIDWDKIEIGAIAIESSHYSKKDQKQLYNLLKKQNFVEVNPLSYFSGTYYGLQHTLNLKSWRGRARKKLAEEWFESGESQSAKQSVSANNRFIQDPLRQPFPPEIPGNDNAMFIPSIEEDSFVPFSFLKAQQQIPEIDLYNGYAFFNPDTNAKHRETFEKLSRIQKSDYTNAFSEEQYESADQLAAHGIFAFSPDPTIQVGEASKVREWMWEEVNANSRKKLESDTDLSIDGSESSNNGSDSSATFDIGKEKNCLDRITAHPSVMRELDGAPFGQVAEELSVMKNSVSGRDSAYGSTIGTPAAKKVFGQHAIIHPIYESIVRNEKRDDYSERQYVDRLGASGPDQLVGPGTKTLEYYGYKQIYGNVGFRSRTTCRHDTFWVNRKYAAKRRIPLYPYLFKNSSYAMCTSYSAVPDPHLWERELVAQEQEVTEYENVISRLKEDAQEARKFYLDWKWRREMYDDEKANQAQSRSYDGESSEFGRKNTTTLTTTLHTSPTTSGAASAAAQHSRESRLYRKKILAQEVAPLSHAEALEKITPTVVTDMLVWKTLETKDYNNLRREFAPVLYNGTRNLQVDYGDTLQRLTQSSLDHFNLLASLSESQSGEGSDGAEVSESNSVGKEQTSESDTKPGPEKHAAAISDTTLVLSNAGSKKPEEKEITVRRGYVYRTSMDFVEKFLEARRKLSNSLEKKDSDTVTGKLSLEHSEQESVSEIQKRNQKRRLDTLFRRMIGYMAVNVLEINSLEAILRYPDSAKMTIGERGQLKMNLKASDKTGFPMSVIDPVRIAGDTSIEVARELIFELDQLKKKENKLDSGTLDEQEEKEHELWKLLRDRNGNLSAKKIAEFLKTDTASDMRTKEDKASIVQTQLHKSTAFFAYDDLGRRAKTIPIHHLKNTGVICADILDSDFVSQYAVAAAPASIPTPEDMLELELRLAEQGFYARVRFSNYINFASKEYLRRLKMGLKLIAGWKRKAKNAILESEEAKIKSKELRQVSSLEETQEEIEVDIHDVKSREKQRRMVLGKSPANSLLSFNESDVGYFRTQSQNPEILQQAVSGSNGFLSSDEDDEKRWKSISQVYQLPAEEFGSDIDESSVGGDVDKNPEALFPSIHAFIRSFRTPIDGGSKDSELGKSTEAEHNREAEMKRDSIRAKLNQTASSSAWERYCGTNVMSTQYMDQEKVDYVRVLFFNHNYFNDMGSEIVNRVVKENYGGWGKVRWGQQNSGIKDGDKNDASSKMKETILHGTTEATTNFGNLPKYLFPVSPGKTIRIDRPGLFLNSGTANVRVRWADDGQGFRFPVHAFNEHYFDHDDPESDVAALETSTPPATPNEIFNSLSDTPNLNGDHYEESKTYLTETIRWPRTHCTWLETDLIVRTGDHENVRKQIERWRLENKWLVEQGR